MSRETALMVSVLLVLVAVIAGLFVVLGREHEAWVAWCVGQGGHVVSDSDLGVGVGIGPKGPVPVVTVSTDYWCLTDDGRILGVA